MNQSKHSSSVNEGCVNPASVHYSQAPLPNLLLSERTCFLCFWLTLHLTNTTLFAIQCIWMCLAASGWCGTPDSHLCSLELLFKMLDVVRGLSEAMGFCAQMLFSLFCVYDWSQREVTGCKMAGLGVEVIYVRNYENRFTPSLIFPTQWRSINLHKAFSGVCSFVDVKLLSRHFVQSRLLADMWRNTIP